MTSSPTMNLNPATSYSNSTWGKYGHIRHNLEKRNSRIGRFLQKAFMHELGPPSPNVQAAQNDDEEEDSDSRSDDEEAAEAAPRAPSVGGIVIQPVYHEEPEALDPPTEIERPRSDDMFTRRPSFSRGYNRPKIRRRRRSSEEGNDAPGASSSSGFLAPSQEMLPPQASDMVDIYSHVASRRWSMSNNSSTPGSITSGTPMRHGTTTDPPPRAFNMSGGHMYKVSYHGAWLYY
jgi:hypothetical protein